MLVLKLKVIASKINAISLSSNHLTAQYSENKCDTDKRVLSIESYNTSKALILAPIYIAHFLLRNTYIDISKISSHV